MFDIVAEKIFKLHSAPGQAIVEALGVLVDEASGNPFDAFYFVGLSAQTCYKT